MKADQFETYSANIDELLDSCDAADAAVKSRIASITSDFKKANGIRNGAVENYIAYTFVSIGNSDAPGRFLGNAHDTVEMYKDYIYGNLKAWYNYGGGKQSLINALAKTSLMAGFVASLATGTGVGLASVASLVVSLVSAALVFDASDSGKSGLIFGNRGKNNDPKVSLSCGVGCSFIDLIKSKFTEFCEGILSDTQFFVEELQQRLSNIERPKGIIDNIDSSIDYANDIYYDITGDDELISPKMRFSIEGIASLIYFTGKAGEESAKLFWEKSGI